MRLLVDTSVWSLAFRRDAPAGAPEVAALARALEDGDLVFTTGLVLQELLGGFRGPRARSAILERFQVLPLLVPSRDDHVEGAEIRNACRRRGVQAGTIDVLLASLCLHHDLTLLTTDSDFHRIRRVCPLIVWGE